MLLNKQNLKDNIKRKEKVVDCGQFQIKVVGMTISQQLEMEKIHGEGSKNSLLLNVLKFCCVDEDNNPLFDNTDEVDCLPADVAVQLFNECLQVSGLQPKDLETKAKN